MTHEELLDLFRIMKDGAKGEAERADARRRIIEANLGLVHTIAERILMRYPNLMHLKRDDIFQAGTEGLLKAVEKFDLGRKLRFSSFAWPTIEGMMMNYIKKHESLLRGKGDAFVYLDESLRLGDTSRSGETKSWRLVDPHGLDFEKIFQDKGQTAKLLDAAMLTAEERKILEMRFGLVDGIPHTYVEIRSVMGRSDRRMRQIAEQALKNKDW